MESTNQEFPLGGNASRFSSWGDVGAPHMATLSLPGLAIVLLVWLFSTSVVQSTVFLEQSNQQPDDTRVTPQSSTSFISPSPSSSSLGEASNTKNQVTKKKEKGKEKKKKKRKTKGGNHALSDKNLYVSFTKETTIIEIVLASHGS